jgi:hypothetical protein
MRIEEKNKRHRLQRKSKRSEISPSKKSPSKRESVSWDGSSMHNSKPNLHFIASPEKQEKKRALSEGEADQNTEGSDKKKSPTKKPKHTSPSKRDSPGKPQQGKSPSPTKRVTSIIYTYILGSKRLGRSETTRTSISSRSKITWRQEVTRRAIQFAR